MLVIEQASRPEAERDEEYETQMRPEPLVHGALLGFALWLLLWGLVEWVRG